MVDNSITPTTLQLQILGAEGTTTVDGDLATYRGQSISPLQRIENPDITGRKSDYNFLVASNGAPGPVTANVHYRAVGKLTAQAIQGIASFFTGVHIGVDDQIHIIPDEGKDNEASYDVFVTWSDAGGTITDLDLQIETIEVPDDPKGSAKPGIPLNTVPNVTDPVYSVAMLRTVKDRIRVYDVFTFFQP